MECFKKFHNIVSYILILILILYGVCSMFERVNWIFSESTRFFSESTIVHENININIILIYTFGLTASFSLLSICFKNYNLQIVSIVQKRVKATSEGLLLLGEFHDNIINNSINNIINRIFNISLPIFVILILILIILIIRCFA